MSAPVFVINDQAGVYAGLGRVQSMVERGLAAGPVEISLARPGKRTLSQNRKMWPMLTDLSKQVDWYGEKLTPEEWKDVITAGLKKQRAVPGIDGGFVVLGTSTSKMKKPEFCDLIELIYAFGSDQGVAWSEPALKAYEEWGNA